MAKECKACRCADQHLEMMHCAADQQQALQGQHRATMVNHSPLKKIQETNRNRMTMGETCRTVKS